MGRAWRRSTSISPVLHRDARYSAVTSVSPPRQLSYATAVPATARFVDKARVRASSWMSVARGRGGIDSAGRLGKPEDAPVNQDLSSGEGSNAWDPRIRHGRHRHGGARQTPGCVHRGQPGSKHAACQACVSVTCRPAPTGNVQIQILCTIPHVPQTPVYEV